MQSWQSRCVILHDGGNTGAGGTGVVYVNGRKVAEGRVENTQLNNFIDQGWPVAAPGPGPGPGPPSSLAPSHPRTIAATRSAAGGSRLAATARS